MWRSRARALLLRSSILWSLPSPPPPPPTRALTHVPPPRPLPRFLTSTHGPIPDASGAAAAAAADLLPAASSSPAQVTPDDILGSHGGANAVADDEEVARVLAVVEAAPEDKVASTLADMVVDFNEPLLASVLLAADKCSCKKLVSMFNYARKKNPAAKSLSNLEILVTKVAASDDIGKMEAEVLWNWVKKFGSVPGSVSTPLLNKMIVIFWKVQKPEAALEVFGKFDEFGCTPDSDSYYSVIGASAVSWNKSVFRAACEACEKMIDSGCFPSSDRIRRILFSFCTGRNSKAGKVMVHKAKLKAAHSLYLAAKEKKIQIPKSALDSLIYALTRNDGTIDTALELLEEYQGKSLKTAGNAFAAVMRGLCEKKKLEDAKTLLMRMVSVGPAPGKELFNSVIAALSEKGEMEDAKRLVRAMESQGISLDACTYSVLMSGTFTSHNNTDAAAKSLSNLEILVSKVAAASDGCKMEEAKKLWNSIKKFSSVPGSVNTLLLNKMILIFCELQKVEAVLEVFGKFNEFGCTPDSDSYYLVITAAAVSRNGSKWCSACEACEKMIDSGCFTNGDKVGRILISLCKENVKVEAQNVKLKVAHSLYLAAKEKKIQIPKSALDSLVCALTRNNETIDTAMELLELEEYQGGSLKNAGNALGTVIHGLCKAKKSEDAKTLLMRMVNVGLTPDKAVFNSVIVALLEKGEMEDAKGLMRVMENQGMITKAHALLRETQKFITYHYQGFKQIFSSS